ncbi:hypothetical protein [Phenylobacterium sp.]|uniref:hypothetical protein n=1 Tax=Phenylobacterium sp. TaxID=1871053 RepID=UPI002735C8AD|nr:hypothetical protein [Phenylobacterium sp.]MDP3853239.1 hypothetical protein [Phenylobacterium sp.]
MRHLIFAAAVLVATPALAAPIRINLVETMGAPVEYRQGRAGAMSSLARTEAAILIDRATLDERDYPSVRLGVKNKGPTSITLLPDNVQVTTQTGEMLTLWTRDEIVAAVEADAIKREKSARRWAAIGAMGAAMRDNPTRPDPSGERGILEAQIAGAAAIEAASNVGFLAQTIRPGEEHMTDLGLGALPKDVTSITVKVTFGVEAHTFPITVTR